MAASALILTSLVASAPAHAASASIPATADTYTTSTAPDRASGTSSKISVGTNQGTRVGYIAFPSDSLGSADQLELTLTIEGGNSGTVQIHAVSEPWAEATATYSNAPKPGALLGTVGVAGGSQTVKAVIPRPKAVGATTSLALQRVDGGVTRVIAREGGAAQAPQLAVVAAASPGSPPANPAQPPANPAQPPATSVPPAQPGESCSVSAKLVPSCGAWFGATANPLAGESWDQAFLNFEKTANRPMDIMHYYKSGQSAMFPTANDLKRQDQAGARRILFYNWRPTGLTWREVADGKADAYLKRLAQHMKANADRPFFLSLNAEMEDEVKPAAGSGQTAKDFAAFYRHVVTVLRANGVSNVVTVVNYIGIQKWGEMPWFEDLYPGNDVVDWIAQDPYSFGLPPVWLTGLAGMVNRTDNAKSWPGFYNWAATKYPSKPQMLAEFGFDEPAAYPAHKANAWRTAEAELRALPKLRALVYWNASKFGKVGTTRVDSSPGSLAAFRTLVSGDYLTAPRRAYLK